jgi:hypothetical protein
MNAAEDKGHQEPSAKSEPEARRQEEARRVIEEYASDLREVIEKLRKKFGRQ